MNKITFIATATLIVVAGVSLTVLTNSHNTVTVESIYTEESALYIPTPENAFEIGYVLPKETKETPIVQTKVSNAPVIGANQKTDTQQSIAPVQIRQEQVQAPVQDKLDTGKHTQESTDSVDNTKSAPDMQVLPQDECTNPFCGRGVSDEYYKSTQK